MSSSRAGVSWTNRPGDFGSALRCEQRVRPATLQYYEGAVPFQARRSARVRRCRPSPSKLDGESHCSKAVLTAGHSSSVIENHAVFLLRPLTTAAFRKTPSYLKP